MTRVALGLAAALAVALTATASARVHPPKKFFGGIVPDLVARAPSVPRAEAANLPYGGGPVLHHNRTHLIFWQPAGSGLTFDAGYEALIERFLTDVAADSRMPTNVYGLSGQYADSHGPATYNSAYAGAVVATVPLPPNGCSEPPPPPLGSGPGWTVCLTDLQLEDEINHVVASEKLPQSAHDIYFLVLPDGLGTCESAGPADCALGGTAPGSFCGYHSVTSAELLYAVIPYNAVSGHCQSDNPRPNASTADPAISTISHEHNETVTDPLGNAWIDSGFQEDGDLCIMQFGAAVGGTGTGAWNEVIHGEHYFLQDEWSNDDGGCAHRDESDHVWFTGRSRAFAGGTIRLTGHGHDPDGRVVSFAWFFGDGRSAHRRLVSHLFRRAGVYRVVLRVTDSVGNWGFYARDVRIAPAR